MPINTELAWKQWQRYAWARDNGHTRYMEKADKCERFFAGDQWDARDRAVLEKVRRPVLTINKILSTVSNVLGEQINNRAEISFRPRSGAPSATADVLSKVFKQISDNNQLDWKRSDMFADGIIGSRGFLDFHSYFENAITCLERCKSRPVERGLAFDLIIDSLKVRLDLARHLNRSLRISLLDVPPAQASIIAPKR